MGKTENCTSILKLNQDQNNVLTPAQQNAVKELKAALKSRPIRRLKDLLGVHGVRMELGNRTGAALELLEMEPSNDDTQSDTDDDTILKRREFFEAQTVYHLISCS